MFFIWDKFLQQHNKSNLLCKCSNLQLPEECFVDAAGFEQLASLHQDLWYLGQGSANSTFFPSKTKFFADALERFDRRRRVHGFPAAVSPSFNAFLQKQRDMHEQCVLQECRLDLKRIQNCKKALQDLVVLCEDHHPNHLMAFCPQFYFASISRTWTDPLVFQELNMDAVALKTCVFGQIPKQLKNRYPWGVDASGSLPVGFVLLKRTKMFRKGRTLVSYLHAPLSRLLMRYTTHVVYCLARA